MHVLSSTIWDLTEIAHVVQYIWEIGELMFGRLRGLVPLRSSWKPSDTKSSPRLPFPLLSSPVIWAVFVQRYRSPPALSPAQLCGHFTDHRTPTWIIRARMKITVKEREARWQSEAPRRLSTSHGWPRQVSESWFGNSRSYQTAPNTPVSSTLSRSDSAGF